MEKEDTSMPNEFIVLGSRYLELLKQIKNPDLNIRVKRLIVVEIDLIVQEIPQLKEEQVLKDYYASIDEDITLFIEERTEFYGNECMTLNELKDAVKSWYKYFDKGRYKINDIIKCMNGKYSTCGVYWYDCRLKPLPPRPKITPFYG